MNEFTFFCVYFSFLSRNTIENIYDVIAQNGELEMVTSFSILQGSVLSSATKVNLEKIGTVWKIIDEN